MQSVFVVLKVCKRALVFGILQQYIGPWFFNVVKWRFVVCWVDLFYHRQFLTFFQWLAVFGMNCQHQIILAFLLHIVIGIFLLNRRTCCWFLQKYPFSQCRYNNIKKNHMVFLTDHSQIASCLYICYWNGLHNNQKKIFFL